MNGVGAKNAYLPAASNKIFGKAVVASAMLQKLVCRVMVENPYRLHRFTSAFSPEHRHKSPVP